MIVQFTHDAIVSNFLKATLYATARLVNRNVIQKFFRSKVSELLYVRLNVASHVTLSVN